MREFHEVANLFPMMGDEEFAKLVEDIAANGLLDPIWLHPNGSIVDGRNRYRACEKAGVEPQFRTWNGEGSLVSFVLSLNLHRRHLDSTQKSILALKVEALLAEEAAARVGGRPSKIMTGTDVAAEKPRQKIAHVSPDDRKSTAQAAAVVGTNRQYVADAKRIKREAPDIFKKMETGSATIVQAKRELKERKREERREENRQQVAHVESPEAIVGAARFATIVIDPPWDWGDEGDKDQLGRARPDYATMSIEQLEQLPVPDLSDDDCHLYLWITNRSLPKGKRLLDAWGFRYITCLTWCKPNFGMGNYFRGQTEHVLFGVRGSQPLRRKDVGTWFSADRGPAGHSSKPTEFLELVESCSPGPYLEMFSRSRRKDWTAWGEGSLGD